MEIRPGSRTSPVDILKAVRDDGTLPENMDDKGIPRTDLSQRIINFLKANEYIAATGVNGCLELTEKGRSALEEPDVFEERVGRI